MNEEYLDMKSNKTCTSNQIFYLGKNIYIYIYMYHTMFKVSNQRLDV